MSTEGGKKMPVNDEPDAAGNLLLTPGPYPRVTVVSAGGRRPDVTLYRSHFATCRNPGVHRKASRPPPPAAAMAQDGLFSLRSVR
ncbi:MAG: hypothetical protein ACRDRX_04570 [Pseudonocardiaceae bacterium]